MPDDELIDEIGRVLESDEDWSADTIERVAALFIDSGRAHLDRYGLFRYGKEPESEESDGA